MFQWIRCVVCWWSLSGIWAYFHPQFREFFFWYKSYVVDGNIYCKYLLLGRFENVDKNVWMKLVELWLCFICVHFRVFVLQVSIQIMFSNFGILGEWRGLTFFGLETTEHRCCTTIYTKKLHRKFRRHPSSIMNLNVLAGLSRALDF